MHLRKRIFIVLFTAFLCFGLFSCKTAPTIADLTPTPAATATPTATPSPTPTPTPTATPEPNVHDFVPGTIDENGYHSDFFRFGFLVPSKWMVYDRSAVNVQNQIDSTETNQETIRKTLIMKLKTDVNLVDFISFSHDNKGYMFLFVSDFNSTEYDVNTEAEALEYFEPSLFAPDNNSNRENLEKTRMTLGGVERPVYRYDLMDNGEAKKGLIFAVQRGTTFALIEMAAVTQDEIEYVLKSVYTLP